ncbi:MAG TPA: hypothetical protein ENI23_16435 [bacterium]|nr:hypothetical protein [bacterium]
MVKHPKAPTLSRADGPKILRQLVDEVVSGNFPSSNKVFQGLMREAGFVSLWFFGRCICALSGPFDLLNMDLHLDMCNVRQSWLKPGTRGAMYIPRGFLKSTIVTELGSAWELLRNPDLRIRISNAVAEKAQGFMSSVAAIYQTNAAVRWLYPEYCVSPGEKENWNQKKIILPNRSRFYREASIETGGIEGAAEGHHYNLHVIDDMIGKKALNVMQEGNVVMETTRQWFNGSQSLLIQPAIDRIIVVGTRYAVDDPYGDIILKSKKNLGFPLARFNPNKEGKWILYYRKAIEHGEVIYPEAFDMAFFKELAEDNWWEYVTQYLNEPESSGTTDLSAFDVKPCWMDFDENTNEQVIVYNKGSKEVRLPLSELDVVQAGDPASTEKYISSKTSRSAQGVVCTDSEGNRFIISLHADYVPVTKFFDWFFDDMEKFGDYIRTTVLEAQGPYRMLGPLLETEQQRRGIFLKLAPVPAIGDKVARIKTTLLPEHEQGRVYVLDHLIPLYEGEQRVFPQSTKRDILDMFTLAIMHSIRPWSSKELDEKEEEEDWWNNRQTNTAGF